MFIQRKYKGIYNAADIAQKVTTDTVDANTTKTGSLRVTGDARLEGTTLAKEIEAGKLTVGNIDNVEQAITDNKAAADKAQKTADGAQKDATKANYKAEAALKVTGNGVLYNHATNLTDGVNQNTLAAEKNTTAITKETNNRVAADTVLSNRISDLGTEIDNVGAISAALAGLHPLDWNGSGSKFQLSAAAGTYDGK